MASSSSCSLVRSILLVLLVVSQISVMLTRADEQLMNQECHNADNPTLCLQCLNSDPESPKADPVGLARIILKCLRSHVDVLVGIISSLASHHREKPVATVLKQCASAYTAAKQFLAKADSDLAGGDYDRAAHDVSSTTDDMLSCLRSIESVNVTAPPNFRFHTRVFLALTEADLRIIDRF